MNKFIFAALGMMAALSDSQEEWKQRLLIEWDESAKLPRKQKKQRRKEIKIDWSIANCKLF